MLIDILLYAYVHINNLNNNNEETDFGYLLLKIDILVAILDYFTTHILLNTLFYVCFGLLDEI